MLKDSDKKIHGSQHSMFSERYFTKKIFFLLSVKRQNLVQKKSHARDIFGLFTQNTKRSVLRETWRARIECRDLHAEIFVQIILLFWKCFLDAYAPHVPN
jgi:hypothetical protein